MTLKAIEAECKTMTLDELKAKVRPLAIEYYTAPEFSFKLSYEEAARRVDMLLVGAARTNLIKDIKSITKKLNGRDTV